MCVCICVFVFVFVYLCFCVCIKSRRGETEKPDKIENRDTGCSDYAEGSGIKSFSRERN